MDEPGAAIWSANHLGFALKPDHATVSRNYSIGGAQRLTRKKHFGSLDTPALLVVRMNLLVPEHRVFEPFRLRKPESRFDLRTYVRFSDSAIEVRHENHRWKLFD